MSDKVFENYDEAHKHSLTIPWKLETCNTGESCWCRIILPSEKILYKDKLGDADRISEFEWSNDGKKIAVITADAPTDKEEKNKITTKFKENS